jgi:hypothetical protein
MFAAVFENDATWKVGGDWSPFSFVIHQVVQPWHPQGTYVHEAALAVKLIAPEAYLPFISKVYAAHEKGQFKDNTVWNKSRQQIYDELVAIAESCGVKGIDQKLKMKETGECNEMTQHIKWAVKYHRCRGVHVTPTVHVNGLEAGIVSSGWTTEQWIQFLRPGGADNFTGAQ